MVLSDGEHFNNAFFLLKKTIEFLHAEYQMHFLLLSSYRSGPQNSVVAYTSPGMAGTFFDSNSIRITVLTEWDNYSRQNCLSDFVSESFFHAPACRMFLNKYSSDKDFVAEDFPDPENRCIEFSKVSFAKCSAKYSNALNLLSRTIEFLRSEYGMHFVTLSAFCCDSAKTISVISSSGPAGKFMDSSDIAKEFLRQWKDFVSDFSEQCVPKVDVPLQPNAETYIQPSENCDTKALQMNTPCQSERKRSFSDVCDGLPARKSSNQSLDTGHELQATGRSLFNIKPAVSQLDTKTSVVQVSSSSKLSYPCHICLKEFSQSSTMKRHIHQFHSKLHTFSCDLCSQIFFRRDKMLSHKSNVHGLALSSSRRAATEVSTLTSNNSRENESSVTSCDAANKSRDCMNTTNIVYLSIAGFEKGTKAVTLTNSTNGGLTNQAVIMASDKPRSHPRCILPSVPHVKPLVVDLS